MSFNGFISNLERIGVRLPKDLVKVFQFHPNISNITEFIPENVREHQEKAIRITNVSLRVLLRRSHP